MSHYEDIVRDDMKNLAIMERLSKLGGDGESSIAPFLHSLQESGFQTELQQFVAERAPAFKAACVDGSYPLEWTQYHNQYRGVHERHFDFMLQRLDLSKQDIQGYFAWVVRLHDRFQDDSEEFYRLLDILTSSEDFDEFLKVMFAEVRRQEESQQSPQEGVWRRLEIHEVDEIEILVPNGVVAGQVLPVMFLGLPYKVIVPDSCGPGTTFTTEITLHSNSDQAFICAFCGSKFDKALQASSVSKCQRCWDRCRKDVCYCGVECQKADWPQHKATCGKIVEASPTSQQ